MQFYYCDCDPLMRWSEAQVIGAPVDSTKIATEMVQIIEAADTYVGISEITIIEFYNQLSIYERDSKCPNFGISEAGKCQKQLMKWVTDGHLYVMELPPKLIEKAMTYVKLATRHGSCALRSWDATHLVQAISLARSMDVQVNIITRDGVFADFLRAFPEFTQYLAIYDPLQKKFLP